MMPFRRSFSRDGRKRCRHCKSRTFRYFTGETFRAYSFSRIPLRERCEMLGRDDFAYDALRHSLLAPLPQHYRRDASFNIS